jgi:predicted naringenin-chalcone synthase
MAGPLSGQILGIGTALPPISSPQAFSLRRLTDALGASTSEAALARRLFRRARVETRHFCAPIPPNARHITPTDLGTDRPGPMEIFRREAPQLAAVACRRALAQCATAPEEITHLVVVTSTGAVTPGPDADLAALLGLRPSVERLLVAFMGCSGAFQGLRAARRAASGPGARVLLVCVELSSIHYRPSPDPGNIAAHALFGDGAAAIILASGFSQEQILSELGEDRCRLEPGLRDLLTWELGPAGFDVALSPKLPPAIEACLRGFVDPLLQGSAPKDVSSWVTHPGGPAILRAVARALELSQETLSSSYEVLRAIGNVSSGSVLFVLERELQRVTPGTQGVMLGFGPGLTLEAVTYRRGGRQLL